MLCIHGSSNSRAYHHRSWLPFCGLNCNTSTGEISAQVPLRHKSGASSQPALQTAENLNVLYFFRLILVTLGVDFIFLPNRRTVLACLMHGIQSLITLRRPVFMQTKFERQIV